MSAPSMALNFSRSEGAINMQIKESDFRSFPTGRLLLRERLRLALQPADVARAVGCHRQGILVLERMNRVIPPGWLDALRGLGLQIPDPIWPQDMPPLVGTQWAEQIKTLIGLGHSAFRWSRKLGVTEEAVRAVLRSRQPVPQSWLLKLAELGVEVPAPVKHDLSRLSSAPRTQSKRASFEEDRKPHVANALPLSNSQSVEAEPPRSTRNEPRRERPSFYFHWTEAGGLHVSMSTAFMDLLPGVFRELFAQVSEAGSSKLTPSTRVPAERA